MIVIDWISNICLLLGGILTLTGAVGLLRLPDFYTRMHAASVTESLAATLLIIGIIFDTGFTLESAKLMLLIFIMITVNPTITHALSRAASHGAKTPEVASQINQKNQVETEIEPSGKESK